MREKNKVQVGDRFMKVDAVQPVIWVVEKVLDTPGLPRHARLVKETGHDHATVSLETLMNSRFFRPIPKE